MDKVVEYDPAAGGFSGAPVVLRFIEVRGWFKGGPEAGYGGDFAKDAREEDLF